MPLAVPLGIFAVGVRSGFGHELLWALVLGSAPYVTICGWLWKRAASVRTRKEFALVSLAAPLFFALLQILAWMIWTSVGVDGSINFASIAASAAARGCISLGFGYVYLALTTLIFLGLRSIGWAKQRDEFNTE